MENKKQNEKQIEKRCYELLKRFGVSQEINGFKYIVSAITEMDKAESKGKNLSATEIYEAVAEKYSSSAMRVERGIRFFVHKALEDSKNLDIMKEIFGTNTRVTNKSFLSSVYNFLKYN